MTDDLSLAFANTVEWHAAPDPEERLTSYGKAVEWSRRHGILSESEAQVLLDRAHADPDMEAAALRRIIALREAVYRIFSAVSHRRPPGSADLDALNAELTEALRHVRLVVKDRHEAGGVDPAAAEGGPAGSPGFVWTWTGLEDELTSLLWPVARDAADLLTSQKLNQVHECADETCGWLFLDLSKNASRRWCDMADCGNRAKAKRYRARKKAALETTGAESC